MTFRHTTVTQIFSLFTIIIIIIIIIISTYWLVVAVSVFIFFTRLLQRYFYGLIFVLPCFETFTPLLLNILTHSFTYFSCVKFTNSRYRSERKRLATRALQPLASKWGRRTGDVRGYRKIKKSSWTYQRQNYQWTTLKARFKRRATAVPNSIDRIKFAFSAAVVRRLKPSRATAV